MYLFSWNVYLSYNNNIIPHKAKAKDPNNCKVYNFVGICIVHETHMDL